MRLTPEKPRQWGTLTAHEMLCHLSDSFRAALGERQVRLTQVRMAKVLGISQDGVSRLEKRSDLLLSTLRKTVEAMGGILSLVAEFPDRPPVLLSSLGETDAPPKTSGRIHEHVHG